ncbi:MAG: lipoprotein insertase outer membrane protein LolB [Betaproteobacteria bacterium]|nr:lipoprotein insertase outer membrane protein LolB [Betaproteobacteria bacterium]MDH5287422.1 lipoprotein insertase outer membrane protein LolB [Betaproteobacteria bacterium]
MLRRRAIAATATLALAACASVAPPRQRVEFVPLADASFAIAGRLSARHGNDGVAANYRWRHEAGSDELLLATPFGGALARLSGGPRAVRLELAGGEVAAAGDWSALTERALGVALPVDGLAWWVRASPRPGSAFAAEADGSGRLEVLRQDGWEIVYGYRDGQSLPLRLTLTHPGVEVRLVVDEWSAP